MGKGRDTTQIPALWTPLNNLENKMISALDLIVYVGLGFLMATALNLYYNLLGSRATWLSWGAAVIAVFSIGFALAWGYASMMESEMQAAWIGLIAFGIIGAIFAAMAGRLVRKTA
jgi:hypothetical protein